jgi:hypothetical protein
MFSNYIIPTVVIIPSTALYIYAVFTIPNLDLYVPQMGYNQIVAIPPYQVFKIFSAILVAQTMSSLLFIIS